MANVKTTFFIGFVGGLVGYACGAAFSPTRAVAQQVTSQDAGPPSQTNETIVDAGSAPVQAGPLPACRQWEVKVDARATYSTAGAVLMDEGWEPFAYAYGGGNIVLRRCVR